MSEQRPPDARPDRAGSPYPAAAEGGVVLDAAASHGRLAGVVRDLVAGAGVPLRSFGSADLVYVVLAGECTLADADRTWTAGPATCWHVPPGEPHRYAAVTDARLLVIAVPAGAEQLLLHEERLSADDPALLLALAQEHHVDVLSGLLP